MGDLPYFNVTSLEKQTKYKLYQQQINTMFYYSRVSPSDKKSHYHIGVPRIATKWHETSIHRIQSYPCPDI
jgi:hypothetical protein